MRRAGVLVAASVSFGLCILIITFVGGNQIVKPMKKLILSVFFIFMMGIPFANAQYQYGMGVRYGYDAGLQYKQFLSDLHPVEVLLTRRFMDYQGVKLIAMYEYQKRNESRIVFVPNLSWVVGGGFHAAYYAAHIYDAPNNTQYPTSVIPIGVDFIVGAEYVFKGIPLAIGLDGRPFYEFVNPGIYYFDAGVTVKYIVDK